MANSTITLARWESSPSSFYVNQNAWSKLSSEYKAIFQAAARRQSSGMLARYDIQNPEALGRLLNQGVEIRPFADDILQKPARYLNSCSKKMRRRIQATTRYTALGRKLDSPCSSGLIPLRHCTQRPLSRKTSSLKAIFARRLRHCALQVEALVVQPLEAQSRFDRARQDFCTCFACGMRVSNRCRFLLKGFRHR